MARPPFAVRHYTCRACLRYLVAHTVKGPLPQRCPECKRAGAPLVLEPGEAPPAPPGQAGLAVVRDPFNSTPGRAPLPDVPRETAPPAETGPGLLTKQITAELAVLRSISPMAETLKASAILVAMAADAVPVDDLKQKLIAIKELRSIIAEITKTAGGEDDGDADGPFGSSAPAVVHQATA